MLKTNQKLAIFMEGTVGTPNGKMGYGVLRYSPNESVCVVDSQAAGGDMTARMGIPGRCPIVATVDEAKALGADALVLGVANSGGFIPPDWYAQLDRAVELGLSMINGLHDPLTARYAGKTKPGQWVWDIRKEPSGLGIGNGAARKLNNTRVLFVGTDMAVGKMTAALELWRGAKERGLAAEFVATGQTGITIRGRGVPLDAVRVDYATAAVQHAVMECSAADYIFVEGQGALSHPGSTSTLPLMRGSCPTHLILCHRAGQTSLKGLEDVPVPPLPAYIDLYERVAEGAGVFARPKCVGVSLNTAHLDDAAAQAAVEAVAKETGLPTSDPVRHGPDVLLNALLAAKKTAPTR